MAWRRIDYCLRIVVLASTAIAKLVASQQQGYVTFNGLPVPGATVTATRDGKNFTCVTNQQGFYSFPDLADGTWNLEVEMFGFAAARREVVVAPQGPAAEWELKILPLHQLKAQLQRPAAPAPAIAPPPPASS